MDTIDFGAYRAEKHSSAPTADRPSPCPSDGVLSHQDRLREVWCRFQGAIDELGARIDPALLYGGNADDR
ncbi:MAG: hypothetical protein Kow0026_23900 [Oricola sp.]